MASAGNTSAVSIRKPCILKATSGQISDPDYVADGFFRTNRVKTTRCSRPLIQIESRRPDVADL